MNTGHVVVHCAAAGKPFDSPDLLPVPPGSLDAVVINMNYHDMVGFGFDRDKINHAVSTALKPGGIMVSSITAPSQGPVRAMPVRCIA